MKDLHKGLPELNIEGGVDNGVDSTVDIAKPREGIVQGRGNATVAVHVQDVGDEEWEPTDDEDACRRTNERSQVSTAEASQYFFTTECS